jgi:hypothetical membrane protein
MRHTERVSLAFGIVSSVIFVANSVILGIFLPHYDPVSQTVSELGERGSPFQTEFELSTIATGIGLFAFSFGLYRYSVRRSLSILPAILLFLYAVSVFGVAVFQAPHPFHNLFGIGGTVGFLAPLALALTWRGEPRPPLVSRVSAILAAVIIAAIALNLIPLFVASAFIEANYGVVQRILFFAFYLWCSYLALSLLVQLQHREVET